MFKGNRVLRDKKFIREVIVFALPMVLQQLITSSVNLLDNLMVGQIGGIAIAAVAATNKFVMIANFGMMGIVTAATIFLAQFSGAQKKKKMKQTFRYTLLSSLALILLFFLAGLSFPRQIIGFFADNEQMIDTAMLYLPIAALTTIPQAVSFSIQSSMRSVGNTKLPLISSVISLFTNGVLNYILIFGKLGLPALGIKGAAIGTLIARFIELIYLLIVLKLNDFAFKTKIKDLFKIPKQLVKNITIKAIPLFCNDIGWAGGMAVLFKFYSSPGETALMALPIASTTADLFFVLFSGVSVATILMISNPLGANQIDLARENGYKMLALSLYLSVLFALGMVGASFITPHFFNVNQEVFHLATGFIQVQALFFGVYMYNTQIFFVIRAGGDTKSTLLMDAGFMWLVNIPTVGMVAYFTHASPILIYIAGQTTDILKMLIARHFFKKEKWLNNLAAENTEKEDYS